MKHLESDLEAARQTVDSFEVRELYRGTAELELRERLEGSDQDVAFVKGIVATLEKRCEELTIQYEDERKLRFHLITFEF